MNRRKWDSGGGDFGKPMHELRLPHVPPTLRKSKVVKRLIGRQKQAEAESKAGQTHISGGGDTFMKSEKPRRGGLTNYE